VEITVEEKAEVEAVTIIKITRMIMNIIHIKIKINKNLNILTQSIIAITTVITITTSITIITSIIIITIIKIGILIKIIIITKERE